MKTDEKQSFEEAFKNLQETANKIKSQDITLEDAIECYESGMKYFKTCEDILNKAEQKIEMFEEAL